MVRSSLLGAFVGALIAGTAVAACGDDSVEALLKEDYLAQGNAICAASNDVLDPAVDEFFETAFADLPEEGPTTAEEGQTVIEAYDAFFDDVFGPQIEEQLAELRALGAPAEDADLLAALYDDVERALEETNTIIDDAVAGDPEAIERFTSEDAEDPFEDVNRRAREYGLTICGEEDN